MVEEVENNNYKKDALSEGCYHCDNKTFNELKDDNKTLVCLRCECEHTDDSVEWGIPIDDEDNEIKKRLIGWYKKDAGEEVKHVGK